VGKYCSKTKTIRGNFVTIHSVNLKKKTTKQNLQPTEKNKIDKDHFEKKIHKKKTVQENIIAIHNVLKKKTTKLNFQPIQY